MIREQAIKEELDIKQKEQNVLNYLEPQSQKMGQAEREMENAKKHLPKEQFRQETKFGLIMYNEVYDPAYVTHGNLPEVVNDFRNAKQTSKMLGIPTENITVLKDASHEQLVNSWERLKDKISALSRPITGKTGILGTIPTILANGLDWDKIKQFVMNLDAAFDQIDIDLDSEDQVKIQDCLLEQE